MTFRNVQWNVLKHHRQTEEMGFRIPNRSFGGRWNEHQTHNIWIKMNIGERNTQSHTRKSIFGRFSLMRPRQRHGKWATFWTSLCSQLIPCRQIFFAPVLANNSFGKLLPFFTRFLSALHRPPFAVSMNEWAACWTENGVMVCGPRKLTKWLDDSDDRERMERARARGKMQIENEISFSRLSLSDRTYISHMSFSGATHVSGFEWCNNNNDNKYDGSPSSHSALNHNLCRSVNACEWIKRIFCDSQEGNECWINLRSLICF